MSTRLSALLAALALAATAGAQTAAPIAPPTLPFATHYRYWPVQFVQWVGPELPWSMIELDLDPNGKHPLLYATLTDRATHKRVHYTDDPALLAEAAALGDEAHKATLAFEPADTEATGSISTLRFTTADGKPLEWRFVQGSDISAQGSGLSPVPEAKSPMFLYREQAAVAGEGTALKIGNIVSTASVWTEISQPPYFVAYRGAESQAAHSLLFTPDANSWTVAAAPTALTPGATWELDAANGNHRSLRIGSVQGTHITVLSTDRFEPGVQTTLELTRIGTVWSLNSARFAPLDGGARHALTLNFAVPLTDADGTTPLTLLAGKTTIASGEVTTAVSAGTTTRTLSFSNPAWLHGKSITTSQGATAGPLSLAAHP